MGAGDGKRQENETYSLSPNFSYEAVCPHLKVDAKVVLRVGGGA